MPAFEPDLHFLQSSWEIRQKQRPSGGSVGLVLMLFHYWQPSLLLFLKRLVILEDFYTASYQVNVTCSLSDLEPEVKLPTSTGSSKKQESSRKTSVSALLTIPKPLTVWITINCGKFWKRWEYQTTWPASWETCMQVRKQQLELDMKQQTGSKLRKEYIKAVYCHPAYLT